MANRDKNLKLSSTAYRVLLILLLLSEGKYSLDELIQELSKDKTVSRTFSKDVLLKYLNTLRMSGFSIGRQTGQGPTLYYLEKAPFLIDFSQDEMYAVAKLENYVNGLYQPILIASFNSAIEKTTHFMKEESFAIYESYKTETLSEVTDTYKPFKSLIKKLEKYCIEGQTIIVNYKNPDGIYQKITIEPKKLDYKNQKVFLYGLNKKISQEQYLCLEGIKSIRPLPTIVKPLNNNFQITFRLTGRLARSYRLYEGERIVDNDSYPSAILVCAKVSDLNNFLHRLLRYGQYCEIVSPYNIRRKMLNLIQQMLYQYEDIGA